LVLSKQYFGSAFWYKNTSNVRLLAGLRGICRALLLFANYGANIWRLSLSKWEKEGQINPSYFDTCKRWICEHLQ